MKLLPEKGIELGHVDKDGGVSLSWAAEGAHETVGEAATREWR